MKRHQHVLVSGFRNVRGFDTTFPKCRELNLSDPIGIRIAGRVFEATSEYCGYLSARMCYNFLIPILRGFLCSVKIYLFRLLDNFRFDYILLRGADLEGRVRLRFLYPSFWRYVKISRSDHLQMF